ncbi:MAG: hypothetical protein J4O01_08025 [Chloroflexi bacterium]|nr:hypothetical protein [Chloroflexota bacterium]
MDNVEAKADAMLRSPLGCGFLLAAEASGLPPEEIASQLICLYLSAYASRDVGVWQPDYQRIRVEILRQGQRHRDLAISILEQPAAADWFGPLDPTKQVVVLRNQQAPSLTSFVAPNSPLSNWERYAEKSENGIYTSTLVNRVASIFVGLDLPIGDIGIGHEPPYKCWLLKAEQSVRVFEIDGAQAWHELCVRYPAVGSSTHNTPDFSMDEGRIVPDWGAVANDWDAVHLSLGGLLTADQVRVQSESGWTYHWSWDIEQTLWLRWVFSGVEPLPDHEPQASPLEGLFHPLFVSRAGIY